MSPFASMLQSTVGCKIVGDADGTIVITAATSFGNSLGVRDGSGDGESVDIAELGGAAPSDMLLGGMFSKCLYSGLFITNSSRVPTSTSF
jgi:hypothetical protein